jgi:hypothetical protein
MIFSTYEVEKVVIRLRRRPRPWPGKNAVVLLRRDVAPLRWRGGCLAEARRAKAGNRVPRACPGGGSIKPFSKIAEFYLENICFVVLYMY